ncbi:PepSY-associated TM helix domain-containing protein [Myroides sp. LoEW2-1]|uniref:PepSY-associated TM helix domain-containing protein n=1 Tax=Myroides sp. LoEW2-1 TaxID=2683192 RepID=UPI001FB75384|nr:PepSY-associated TM helix domain-containing protein [Myroides sp. LoEW2-1]
MGDLLRSELVVLPTLFTLRQTTLHNTIKKTMNVKNYNRYFHLHTISGIIITVILYIFFFAGSFAFFKNEINSWQNNAPKKQYSATTIDYETILDSIDTQYGLYGRSVSFRLSQKTRAVGLNIQATQDSLNPKAKERSFGSLDPESLELKSYSEGYALGEFLYRLHFFAQVNSLGNFMGWPIGYMIAGFVSFAFLFALITGLLVHWQKIVSNFYIFRPWEKIKTVWTDLHTALGVISFPFQLIFAVTGCYFLMNYYIIMNSVALIGYQGDNQKLQEEASYRRSQSKEIVFQNKPLGKEVDLNYYVDKTIQKWDGAILSMVQVTNYGDQGMTVRITGNAPREKRFHSQGEIIYEVATGEQQEISNPNKAPGYGYTFANIIYELHFGAFGGYATRIAYFLVGIAGCIVILSGVLIWLVARDKKNVPERKRKFNFWLANIYMAICLSMYPITALSFIAVKINPNAGQEYIYSFYFWSWLIASILLSARKSIYKTNRDCLLLGSIIGLIIPLVNGIVTGSWFWDNWKNGYHDILLIDLFWIIVPIITLIAWKLIRNKHEQKQMTN